MTAKKQNKTARKRELVQKYMDISKKVKRIASLRDCELNGLSQKTIRYHFDNKIENLKRLALRNATFKKWSKQSVEYKTTDARGVIYKLIGVKSI